MQVGDLGMLMHAIENDSDSKQHLKSCLKLDDPVRWNRLREAVNMAVAVDNRIRVFCSTSHSGSDGDDLYVLFNTHEGRIFFDTKDPNDPKLSDPPSILGMLTRAAGSNNVPTCVPYGIPCLMQAGQRAVLRANTLAFDAAHTCHHVYCVVDL